MVALTLTDSIRAYTGTAAMMTDGYQLTDPEFIRATEFLEQTLTPALFFVGKYTASVAQVDTVAVGTLVATGHVYSFMLNSTLITYTSSSDTQQSILTALLTAINTAFPSNPPVTGVVTGSGSGALLTLTSPTPGVTVTYATFDTDLTHLNTVANHGIPQDIAQAQLQNNTWYGLCICSNQDQDILQTAAFIESQTKIFIAVSSDAAIGTSSATDIGSIMKLASYKRSGLMYSPASYAAGIEAAWLGGQLPATPGSNNWAYKTLEGIIADNLTATQIFNCIGVPVQGVAGKNVNIYTVVNGVDATQMGWMAGGQFIDITIGVDWLKSTMQTNLLSALVNSKKIPYTDSGVTILLSAVKSAIDQGVVNGLIDGNSPISITAPPVLSVPVNQRANRIAPTITFVCRLQGAFNSVVVQGIVTV